VGNKSLSCAASTRSQFLLDNLGPQIKDTEDKFNQGQKSRDTIQIGEMVVCYLNDLGLPAGPHVRLNFADMEVTAVADRVVFEV